MLTRNWLNGVRGWFSDSTRTRASSRNANRRSLPRRGPLQVERLEERSLLSALSISDVAVVEGNAGTANAVFTITLSAADTRTVTVTAATTDNTATSGVDYTPLATTWLFRLRTSQSSEPSNVLELCSSTRTSTPLVE